MNYSDQSLHDQAIDLTNCDREPIHIPGRIQAFGALIGFTPDFIITHASQNLGDMTAKASDDVIGLPLDTVFDKVVLSTIRTRMQALQGRDVVERMFRQELFGDGKLYDVALHLSGRTIILELEPASGEKVVDYIGMIRPMIDRVSEAGDVEAAAAMAVRQLRMLIGYDRVMCYRFHPDRSGEVVAEAKSHDLEESFLGLRYPASDIPRQAHALYLRNLLRIISDVDGATVPIDPPLIRSGQPLDLSLSTLRAVSPLHLEYLANMGVDATQAISVVVRGKLWGMLVCHHYGGPRLVTYEMRTAAELFAQLFAFTVDQKLSDAREAEMVRARIIHDQVMASLADGTTIEDNFHTIADAIETVIPHDGMIGWVDGRFTSRGVTPTKEEFQPLSRYLNTTPVGQVYATDHIAGVYPKGEDWVGRGAGLLALPVSRRPRDYLVLFRSEAQREATWAGNPDKPVETGPNGIRLTPRKSFAAWKETVTGRSKQWTDGQMSAAEALRMTLLEVVLRMTDQAVQERTRAQEQQELLIAELNHRVRNILKLIQGLVAQSSDVEDVAAFTKTVGGRIHALARAHDQITKENWNPASVHDLLRTEGEAYLNDKSDRLVLSGTDALLDPTAFTTISLVMHEMLTNAMKYGALADQHGRVDVEFTETPKGDLLVQWQEVGGPPVRPPTRRGFGTTITERSIPFELRGEADITYATEGVQARFVIPAEFISDFSTSKRASDTQSGPAEVGRLSENALVVEDNLIIALDAEDMLLELGARKVFTAAGVSDALDIVEREELSFALLDVNLGSETSTPVAEALKARGVPFAFATGYGDQAQVSRDMPGVPVVQKPYGKDTLSDVLLTLKLS